MPKPTLKYAQFLYTLHIKEWGTIQDYFHAFGLLPINSKVISGQDG